MERESVGRKVKSESPKGKGRQGKTGCLDPYLPRCLKGNTTGENISMFGSDHEYYTITDGGVAPPTLLLTIVMISLNLKSLRISRNSKDSRED